MDKKRLAIVMVLSMAVVFGWTYMYNRLRQQHPEWFQQPEQTATQTSPATDSGGGGGAAAPSTAQTPGVVQATQSVAPATVPTATVQAVGGEAQPALLGDPAFDPKGEREYPLALNIDPQGAGLRSVTLNRFRREVERDEPYIFQQPYEEVPADVSRALATRYGLSDINWVRKAVPTTSAAATQPSTSNAATYTVELRDAAGQPMLAIDKQYRLHPKSHESLGYEVVLTYTLRNLTNQPAKAMLVFNGPNVPSVENTRDIPEVVSGYNDERQLALVHEPGTSFEPDKEPQTLTNEDGYPLVWAGILNAYFEAIVRSDLRDGKSIGIGQVQASAPRKRTDAGQEFTTMTFQTPELTVAPGQQVSVPYDVYFGPRQRAVLNQAYYANFPRDYDQTLVLTSGPCGYCTFQPLIDLLVYLLSFFHMILRDWGLAIIMLVLLVRLLLHPITKRSQIAMSRMSKMGPEIERLKKKHGDNKEELNKAMMSVYREQGITPILGCLPMLLQMPIWIALWSALQSTFELRHASFLWGYTWIEDLAQPDRLVAFRPVKLWFFHLDAINLLPLILGVVFFIQQKMTPKAPNMTPEQEQQYKMMQWMSLLFPLLLYSGPSGLNLYIATSTAIGIWESKRVRDHLKAQEEAEKLGVVVTDKPDEDRGRGPGPTVRVRGPKQPEAPKGRIGGWLANLQAKAEEVQREMEKKKRRDSR